MIDVCFLSSDVKAPCRSFFIEGYTWADGEWDQKNRASRMDHFVPSYWVKKKDLKVFFISQLRHCIGKFVNKINLHVLSLDLISPAFNILIV